MGGRVDCHCYVVVCAIVAVVPGAVVIGVVLFFLLCFFVVFVVVDIFIVCIHIGTNTGDAVYCCFLCNVCGVVVVCLPRVLVNFSIKTGNLIEYWYHFYLYSCHHLWCLSWVPFVVAWFLCFSLGIVAVKIFSDCGRGSNGCLKCVAFLSQINTVNQIMIKLVLLFSGIISSSLQRFITTMHVFV